MELYNRTDLDVLNVNIDLILKSVQKLKDEKIEPNIYEINNIRNICIEYISKNKRKLYGGLALHYLLQMKKAREYIYDRAEDADIDFYSPEPIEDLINLCNLFNEKGYKFVRGREAMHKETYSLYVNNRLFCNISYMPKFIYNSTPFIKYYDVNNNLINIVAPQVMAIDYLRVFTDPLGSYWRIKDKKAFERFYLLQKYFPFEKTFDELVSNKIKNSENQKKAFDIIDNYILNNDNLIIIGNNAYNIYLEESGILKSNKPLHEKYKVITQSKYEIISTEYEKDIMILLEKLKRENIKIETKEYYPFFQFTGQSTDIYVDDELICKIYDSNKKSIPYQKIIRNKKRLQIGTFNLCLMFELINLLYTKVNNKLEENKQHKIKINNLIEIRNYYLTIKNKNILDCDIFRDLSLQYRGEVLLADRERQIIGEERKKKNKPFIFQYNPEIQQEKENNEFTNNYIFTNTSGNQIIKYQMLKFPEHSKIENKVKQEEKEEELEIIIETP